MSRRGTGTGVDKGITVPGSVERITGRGGVGWVAAEMMGAERRDRRSSVDFKFDDQTPDGPER